MQNKNQKIRHEKRLTDRSRMKSSAFRKFRVAEFSSEPLTIFAKSKAEAQSVARRLNGLRRLVADLAVIREELEKDSAKPTLFPLSSAVRQIEIAFPGCTWLRSATELIGGWQVWLKNISTSRGSRRNKKEKT